jgi:hypothetical protein
MLLVLGGEEGGERLGGHAGQDPVLALKHYDLGAQRPPRRGDLQADVAAAHDGQGSCPGR